MTAQNSNWKIEATLRNARIDARLAELGIHYRGAPTFIPASQFEGDEFKSKAVNFNCTIDRGDACIYRGPYAYGVGCLPGYRSDRATKMLWAPVVDDAIERGRWPATGLNHDPSSFRTAPPVPAPKLRDVMCSLLSDASAIDHPNFESWAGDFCYDTDSRKAEQIYRACVETGLALRAGLGEAVLAELRELFADY